jgi:hypothetical protein
MGGTKLITSGSQEGERERMRERPRTRSPSKPHLHHLSIMLINYDSISGLIH